MLNFILNRDANGNVNYLYRNDNTHPVTGKIPFANALAMLKGDVHASDEYPGYPLTVDDKYFFDGQYEIEEAPKKPKKRIKDVVCE